MSRSKKDNKVTEAAINLATSNNKKTQSEAGAILGQKPRKPKPTPRKPKK